MTKQLYYEDIEVGTEIPSTVNKTSRMISAMWAGASGDYDPIHYDVEWARDRALPSTITNASLKVAFLCRMLGDLVGDGGWIRKFACQHRGMDIVGDPIVCKGRVTGKRIEGNDHLVECEVWTENPKGEKTAPGSAIVILPSRAHECCR